MRVALIATDELSGTPTEWRPTWSVYEPAVRDAADAGAEIVVLPEKLFLLEGAGLAEFEAAAASTATELGVDLVVGYGAGSALADGAAANRATLFAADGARVDYDKQHLIPFVETRSYAAAGTTVLAPTRGLDAGLAICKDLDFPTTMRDYAGAAVLLVPAWDFDVDAWFHSRMAMLRGVEHGYSVARAARQGLLVLSDPSGRVVAEAASAPGIGIVVAELPNAEPVPTVYSRIGDAVGWAALGLAAGLLVVAARRDRPGAAPEPLDSHHEDL